MLKGDWVARFFSRCYDTSGAGRWGKEDHGECRGAAGKGVDPFDLGGLRHQRTDQRDQATN